MIERAIQIYPMVPLAKASAILRISREELINRLSSGELMGEKRRIGESKKDSWFIYADQFDRLLTQTVSKYEDRVTTRGLEKLFTSENKPQSPQATPLKKSTPSYKAEAPSPAVAETVAIEPVAVDIHESDYCEIVDALGTNYAMGSDYDTFADNTGLSQQFADAELATTAANSVQLSQMQLMMSQLVQHLQDERQQSAALKDRLLILENEVELLRNDVLGRPDKKAHSAATRVLGYFRVLLGIRTDK